MIGLLQRVSEARVEVAGETLAERLSLRRFNVITATNGVLSAAISSRFLAMASA